MDLEVVIEGVSDKRVSKAIERKIRQVCTESSCSGQWSVNLSPSETRGEWDLGVRGPLGPYFASFAEPVDRWPEMVAERLRAYFSVVSPTGSVR